MSSTIPTPTAINTAAADVAFVPPNDKHTTADQVVAENADQIAGKIILITGVSPNGLGSVTALSLAAASPALLILASRSASKIAETAAEIAAKYPTVPIRALVLDLNSLASVRAAAAEVNSYPEARIDALINNAGIMATPHRLTADGFEAQFGTNHLGHFLFTCLIFGRLRGHGRVVNVSSFGHTFSDIHWDSIDFDAGKSYDKWLAYGQAKTANILFSVALAKRGVLAYSLHPGNIMTNLGREIPEAEVAALGQVWELKTQQEGAATHVVAAFDERIRHANGSYLEDGHLSMPKSYAVDPESAERLWKLSEKLVGEKFDF